MIVYFVMPDAEAKKINGFLGRQYRKMKITEITRDTFRNGFQHFGAVLVVPDRAAACSALKVELNEPGIIEGIVASDHARKIGKSRQWVHKMIRKGLLTAERIGPLWVVK